jgi:hypothetical protein
VTDALARVLYDVQRAGVIADGFDCPEWEQLPPEVLPRWRDLAQAVIFSGLVIPAPGL